MFLNLTQVDHINNHLTRDTDNQLDMFLNLTQVDHSNNHLTRDTDNQLDMFLNLTQVDHSNNHLTRDRSEEHTSELQSLMRISYAVFCLKKQTKIRTITI